MRGLRGLITAVALLGAAHVSATTGPVTYTVDGQAYEGYFADAQNARGLVLLIHDWDGLTEYEIKRAGMLKALGYDVFAADLFGAGVRPTEVADKRQHTGELYRDRQHMRTLMLGALEAAASRGADTGNTVAMGYCFGGAAVLELARAGSALKGFATFHGGLATPGSQNYAQTRGPIAVYHGSADTAISLQEFASLADALEQANIPHRMTTYGGAPHAFTVFDSDRYRETADRLSWSAFQQFLKDVL